MSNYRFKTKYETEGAYGSTEEKTVYVNHNLSSDYVTFYDEDGGTIMVIPDTIANNLLDAINRLYAPFKIGSFDTVEGVESMNKEDRNKCGL